MAPSMYAPLRNDSREFRLLVLEPSTDRLAPVRCMLNQASFDNDDLKYMALSYVWADPPGTTSIIVNGVETQITLNLEAALRHIRQPAFTATLWVDALCINQKDLAEKNHQVNMMGEIYSGAELVIAWLGSARENSDLAMAVLGKSLEEWKTIAEIFECESAEEQGLGHPGSSTINGEQEADTPARTYEQEFTGTTLLAQSVAKHLTQDKRDIIDQPGPSPNIQRSSTSNNPGVSRSDSEDHCWEELTLLVARLQFLAIARLLKRSWWYRVWVVQEVMLAKKFVFKCGHAEISGGKMSSWRYYLHTFHLLSDEHEATGLIASPLYLLETLNDTRHLRNDAVDLLSAHGKREATRPHDHIYGLLGVMSTRDRRLLGAPDYGCRAEDLFINVAAKLMKDRNSLELLVQAGIPRLLVVECSTKMNLPSWVPDWTRPWLKLTRTLTIPQSRPDVLAPSSIQFSEDMKELTFHGFYLDKIESVKSIPALAAGEMPIWRSVLMTGGRTKGDRRPPPLHGLVVAMFSVWWIAESPDDEEVFQLFASFFRELKEYRISVGCYESSGDHDNSDYLVGFLDWIGEARDGRTEKDILEKIFSVEFANSFVEWYHRQSSEDLQRFYQGYSLLRNGASGTAGFSMFRTCKGSFGIMEAAAAADDLLCIVHGCHAPLVLRKFRSPKYLLIGPSGPLAGSTNEELECAVKNGEITKESFTLV